MVQRHFNISRGTMFLGFLIFSLMLLFIPDRHTGRLNDMFVRFFNPVLSIGGKLPDFRRSTSPSGNDIAWQQKYDALWNAYHNQAEILRKRQSDYEELARIRSALPQLGGGLICAKVIRKSISGTGHKLTINKGANAGVKEGQYVLGPNIQNPEKSSIVGTISKVQSSSATVRLLTDKNQSMVVNIRRQDGDEVIQRKMTGDGKGACKPSYISKNEFDASVGDTVFAAAREGFLDTGVVIGQVTDARGADDNPALWDITVTPIYVESELNEVAVIAMVLEEDN